MDLGNVVEHERELCVNGITTRSTVLMILDKLYNVFKSSPINDVDLPMQVSPAPIPSNLAVSSKIEKTVQNKRKLSQENQISDPRKSNMHKILINSHLFSLNISTELEFNFEPLICNQEWKDLL